MESKKALEILEHYQKWRLGKINEIIYTPKELTQALDVAIVLLKQKS